MHDSRIDTGMHDVGAFRVRGNHLDIRGATMSMWTNGLWMGFEGATGRQVDNADLPEVWKITVALLLITCRKMSRCIGEHVVNGVSVTRFMVAHKLPPPTMEDVKNIRAVADMLEAAINAGTHHAAADEHHAFRIDSSPPT